MNEYVPPSPERLAMLARVDQASIAYNDALLGAISGPMQVYEDALKMLLPETGDKTHVIENHRGLNSMVFRHLRSLTLRAKIAAQREDDAPATA